MGKYKSRITDKLIERKLKGKGALLIEGPKWCGKTTTAERFSKSVLYMSKPEDVQSNLMMADINPSKLLSGETPRLIDEWQIAPKLWDAVRFEVDHRDNFGHFILTGSAVPPKTNEIFHTGTGRFAWIKMRPMSLFESMESTGEISLKELFNQPAQLNGENKLNIDDLAFLICRGGWPEAVDMDKDVALDQAFDYYTAIVNTDISKVDDVKRDPERAKRLMKSYARNQGSQIAYTVIRDDIAANDSETLTEDTVYAYTNALRKIFVIEDMPAWNPNLRSKTAIRTSDTRYFIDPSIATASLGMGPEDLIKDLNTMGLFFETMCVRDLRVYAESIDGEVYHYRDKSGLECDTVVHLRNGSFGLIEIKLGGDKLIEEGAENLKTFSNKIDTNKMKAPSFLMVLTGTGKYAYRREDGVYVVPIGCLKN
ncbi:ATP-binding protein [Treponema sp.]|uniref:ATP-binding protein n=1 Tax=Treponema sp. TaxID=166 RepID=UPI003FD6E5CF